MQHSRENWSLLIRALCSKFYGIQHMQLLNTQEERVCLRKHECKNNIIARSIQVKLVSVSGPALIGYAVVVFLPLSVIYFHVGIAT